jgi:hypothetical protein
MLTKSEHAGSSLRQGVHGFLTRVGNAHDLFSLRPGDAPIGTTALASMIFGVVVIPIGASFGEKGIPLSWILPIFIFLFPPAMLGGIYSLFFERSKVCGSLDLLLAAIVLLVQPLTWYWVNLYLPFAGAFTIFCGVVRMLERKRKR